MLIRLQADRQSDFHDSQAVIANHISKAAKHLPPARPTLLNTNSSWEKEVALLNAWSMYLKHGPGVWRHREGSYAVLHDDHDDPEIHVERPPLLKMHSSSVQDA